MTEADKAIEEAIDALIAYTYANNNELAYGDAYSKLHNSRLKARKLRQEELSLAEKAAEASDDC